ncbi:MAG: hypothetical protein VKL59_08630 [Nostocaceae cyanobacterium]|nr:hypothetical protein [Nostocaceae cyanobacterium]
MTEDRVTQPKWVVAANERVRLLITFAPELDAIVDCGEQFITTRRYQQIGRSNQGDYVESIAILVAPKTEGLTINLCKKLWVNWRTPVESPVLLESRLYTRLFALPKGFRDFLPDDSHPAQLVQFEKFALPT